MIQTEIDKIEGGRALMIPPNEKMLEENMRMRKQKYEYFA